MQSSVREIRIRLLLLLGRAFVIVLLLSVFFFLLSVGYFLTSSTPLSTPFVHSLEAYYLGHGNWSGVDDVFQASGELSSLNTVLLDKDERILLDRQPDSALMIGSVYEPRPDDVVFDLKVNDEKVGSLVIASFSLSARLRFVRGIVIPVSVISIILALFLVVVAVLLLRRFVNPLADVIYAARAVTSGKLDTRISSKGQQDLRSLSDSFNEMASALERNDRERREMFADIAHELRTPLSIIRGRLEGIMDGIYSADGSQVSMALEQTYLLERLVDDLRLLTLAETRELPFEIRQADLHQLAQHTLDLFSAEASEKNISLSLEKGSGNFQVALDPQRTEQVIGNLMGNALRYIPEGGKVWLVLEETENSVRLSVNDNGPGVPQEDLPYLFDRFWRKEKSRARLSGGSGLGLAITKQLVEAQGGTIEANNLSEGGLQVMIEWRGNSK
jgi:two-component system OmpR family sensor kinase/two-component system sensor histidine kinase BaeS